MKKEKLIPSLIEEDETSLPKRGGNYLNEEQRRKAEEERRRVEIERRQRECHCYSSSCDNCDDEDPDCNC